MAHPNFLLNSSTLVIGGSSGIGFAVASAALSSASKLRSLYSGAHVSGSAAALSNTETLEATLKSVLDAAVKETGGYLDHIVFTAGDSLSGGTLAEVTVETALKPFTLRYLGSLLIGKLVTAYPGKYTKPAASSSITFTSGIMASSFAVELAPIRTNVIIPGALRTELLDRMSNGNSDAFKGMSLTKQVGSAADAAEAYLFCMRSALATGQTFKVDGGFSLV
ncbi:hypothetical protein C8R45DRAFT_922315 [Mycena sanguinolenta]|nr:hypothetical protein C8R45DRAFT_922315 [Mycena sanguinolenta]